ncbi:hypothetical protein BJ165DRAFT_1325601, partial [Panaeolus papilionaceus]
ITVHKAMGGTLDAAIIDLADCNGSESPYVMLSHVRSWKGLYILCQFQIAKIQSHPNSDVIKEFNR